MIADARKSLGSGTSSAGKSLLRGLQDVARALGINFRGTTPEQLAQEVAVRTGLSRRPTVRPPAAKTVLGHAQTLLAPNARGVLAPPALRPGGRPGTPPPLPRTQTGRSAPPPLPPRGLAAPSGRPEFPQTSKFSPWKALVPLAPDAENEYPIYPEIYTPGSSNVFSFTYSPQASILYVTFKAVRLHEGSTGVGRGRRGGESQLRGRLGGTVAGKSDSRGPTYAYLDVPERVYERMKRANSKGKFVWDELRIRGTIYGHKYQYTLVHGSPTAEHGLGKLYIPRKATREGFKVRSVATVGQGRRGYQSSTLPGQRGHGSFSTFRTRPGP